MAVSKNTVSYTIVDNVVKRTRSAGGTEHTDEVDAPTFLDMLGVHQPADTGFIPRVLRRYSRARGVETFLLELEPGINVIEVSQSEHSSKTRYLCAQPWRIVSAMVQDNSLVGARMFYSPEPIMHPEQQLYSANVPNLNCYGYNGVSVGWLCLYHKENWKGWDLQQKIIRLVERCNGGEAYNYNNMSETDGLRLYQENDKPKFTWDFPAWEAKTEAEGLDWVFDPDLWIPLRVTSADDQAYHNPKGEPLTVDMVMNGKAVMYYFRANEQSPGVVAVQRRKDNLPSLTDDQTKAALDSSYNVALRLAAQRNRAKK